MKNRIIRILALAMLLALVVGTVPAMAASKTKIVTETLWANAYGIQMSITNIPEDATVTSAKSSNTSVLTVSKQGTSLYDLIVFPHKAGKAKVTVKYKVGKKSYTISATYTVKKYPNAIKSLKVNGKTVNLSKNKIDYALSKYKKTTATVTVKAASGWKVNDMSFYTDSTNGDVKSGKSFKIPKGENGGVIIDMRNTKTKDYFLYHIGFYR